MKRNRTESLKDLVERVLNLPQEAKLRRAEEGVRVFAERRRRSALRGRTSCYTYTSSAFVAWEVMLVVVTSCAGVAIARFYRVNRVPKVTVVTSR